MRFINPIEEPKLGNLSQGTVFTCAAAENYCDTKVFGLVITARCDIAQSKVQIFNYLPLVSFDDWIHRDGRAILCDRIMRQITGKMKAALKKSGFSESILKAQPPDLILRTLFPILPNGKKNSTRDQFSQYVTEHEGVSRCQASAPNDKLIIGVADQFCGERDTLVRELVTQRLNGYYFLQSAFPGVERPGYVVLLREIYHIPQALGVKIASGISYDEYRLACVDRNDFCERLCFTHDDFAMPIGILSSPFIEHLMQSFSTLFARIGLPDLESKYIDTIWISQPSVERPRT